MRFWVYRTHLQDVGMAYEYRHRASAGFKVEESPAVGGVARKLKGLVSQTTHKHLNIDISFQAPRDAVRRDGRWYRCFSLTSEEQELFWKRFNESSEG